MDPWLKIGVGACDHAGLTYRSIETLVTWDQKYCANALYRLDGQRYLKVFGPTAERQYHIERVVLRSLDDHPVIPAPRILAAGEPTSGQPYLVLTAIPGKTAEEVWDDLPRPDQLAIAQELGTITAAIHQLPQEYLAAVERQYGGRHEHIIRPLLADRIAEIEATVTLSVHQKDALLRFLHEEAPEHLAGPLKVLHFDLAHNHIYLSQDPDKWWVTGILDWGEAVLGPPEWDIVYLWHWTFTTATQDKEAMQTCLETFFAAQPRPERFARRCLAAVLHTPSMWLLWPDFAAQAGAEGNIVRAMTEYFYPPNIFGRPD
jgi:aminoglycoside phosphotransferase (APT) family kinase protein